MNNIKYLKFYWRITTLQQARDIALSLVGISDTFMVSIVISADK